MTTLTAEQERILDRALDDLIPPSADGRLPGAGAVHLAPYLANALSPTPMLWDMIVESIDALEKMARARHERGFTALARDEQGKLLADLGSSANAFPPVLMIHTFAGYYQQPAVLAVFGYESRPPHPRGYEMEPDDLSLLEPVRQRGRVYR